MSREWNTIYEFVEVEFGDKDAVNMVEIGAHVGSDTLHLYNFVKGGRMLIFEPDPRNISALKNSIAGSNITLIEKAVGYKPGKSTFHLSSGAKQPGETDHTASSSLRAPKTHLIKFPWVKFENTIEVNVTTLDESWGEETIDLLWMDVQGAELDVVKGGKRSLCNTKYIFMEFNDGEMYEDQATLDKILSELPGEWGISKVFGDEVLLQNKAFGTHMIKPKKEIFSVVLQGPVLSCTKEAIESIRRWFPKTEIILSTWMGENASGLPVDRTVISKDPGGGTPEDYKYGRGNMARLIIGCSRGVEAANNEHILKVRTDTIFTGDGFLEHIGRWPKRDPSRMIIFEDKIIVPNVGTADPEVHVCFQITDWVMFGKKNDLTSLFNVPTENIAKTLKSPEQNMWLHSIRKVRPDLDIDHVDHRPPEAIAATKEFMSNNLIILDTKAQFNFYSGKYPELSDDHPVNMRYAKWAMWYGEML